VLATCPYPEPDRSSPCLHVPLPEDPSKYPPICAWVFQVVSFPQISQPKPSIHLSPPYMLHASPILFFLLITQTILDGVYRSLSSSLCGFLHSPVTSSLLGTNILFNNCSQTLSAYVLHSV
jgi:hypothetical protein